MSHHSKPLFSEPAGPQPEEQWGPLCPEVINYAIWQGNTTRFIAESAADGPERKTQICTEMQRCRNAGPRPWEMGVCARVCAHPHAYQGRERTFGWELRLCHFLETVRQKANTLSPCGMFLTYPPPRVGKDWDSGCQGVCVGRGRDVNGEVRESGKILERMGFFFHGSPSGFSIPSLFCILI